MNHSCSSLSAHIYTPIPLRYLTPRRLSRNQDQSRGKLAVFPPASITPQHALDKIAEGTPEVLAAGEAVLVDEEDVLLETRVEVGLEAELADDGVVVAVDVGVDAVHALEDLAHGLGEGLGEGHADARGQHALVVDVPLHPAHQLLDVGRGSHLGRAFVGLVVLPEVLESATVRFGG